MKENIFIFIDFARKLYERRYMLRMMTLRELRAQYVGSVFGFAWAVTNPLFQLAIYGVVFGVFFKSTPPRGYGTESYFLFLLCSLVPWQFFSQAVSMTTNSIVSNRNLIKKAAGFPCEVLPMVTVASNVISHLIGVALILLIIIVFRGGFKPHTPLIFLYLFFISLFAVGLGWVLSGMTVFLRDMPQVIGLLLSGLFFFTPIFYSPAIVPERFLFILKLNPVYHMVEGYRLALLAGRALPSLDFLYLVSISLLTFGLGGMFFRKLKPGFAEVL